MESVDFQLNDKDLENYMREMKFSKVKGSVFLLGVLIAQVGVVQFRERESKPILNKINFQGMNQTKLQMLSVDVFEKLKQLKVLNVYNEQIYFEHSCLFEEASLNWNLSNRETVFYLLSGYAYETNRILSHGKEKVKVTN